ncbi:MAG TPA: hypothetical protein VN213_21195 [Solirubrobacteraceae bacterium]|nr:hypothetical protein [Solirubrobacteraceae bacterium]
MGYKILGWAVWNGAKLFLRRKYGRAMVPVPVLAGGVVLAAVGVALAARRSGGESAG